MKKQDWFFILGAVWGIWISAIITATIVEYRTEKRITKQFATKHELFQMIDIETKKPVWVRPSITNIYAPQN